MNLMQAFDVLKADIESEILTSLPDGDFENLQPIIERAFETGSKIWREQSLVTLLGRRGAERLLKDLESKNLEKSE